MQYLIHPLFYSLPLIVYILRYQKIQTEAKKKIRVTTFNVKNCRKNKIIVILVRVVGTPFA